MRLKTILNLTVISVFSLFLFTACSTLNSSEMFRIAKKSNFIYDTIPNSPLDEHKISFGDRFSFSFSTNNGEKIIFGASGISNPSSLTASNTSIQQQDYLVQQDGTAELPLIGTLKVAGMSTRALEDQLENLLEKDYLEPFVQIKITNQRVLIFPGKNSAQVITLQNTNTSLIEVIALSNGIREDGRANSIKLMRKKDNKRLIYKIDLSTIEGMKYGEMLVQSNDYIYIDSKPRITREILKEIGPWLSLFSSSLAIFAIFTR
jgi:polysaccharide biosynthesis/export protein